MKQMLILFLKERNINVTKNNIDVLYQAGIENIFSNIDFYFDKPYSCESVLKKLFIDGVNEKLNCKK